MKQCPETIPPDLISALLDDAYDWLASLYPGDPPARLDLDDDWHYLDRDQRHSYKGSIDPEKPQHPVDLVYFTFKGGGQNHQYDPIETLRRLRHDHPAPKRKPRARINTKPKRSNEQEEKERRENLERDVVRWRTLAPAGASGYLERKGLPPFPAARYGNDRYGTFLALMVQDADGNPHGLQRIYDHGGKFFTKGLRKKGAFILIDADEDLQHQHAWSGETIVVEGAATGLAAHLATGARTVIALDAGNLPPSPATSPAAAGACSSSPTTTTPKTATPASPKPRTPAVRRAPASSPSKPTSSGPKAATSTTCARPSAWRACKNCCAPHSRLRTTRA